MTHNLTNRIRFQKMRNEINRIAFTDDDMRSLVWLCEMAAIGCRHEGKIAWAGQLEANAADLRERIPGRPK